MKKTSEIRDLRLALNGLLILAVLCCIPFLWAAESKAKFGEEAFARGNAAFAAGQYADAIRDYESVVAQRSFSPALFYNLGNACFRSGQTGQAILNYERALWLDPNDSDIKANLRFVRKAAGLFEPAKSWWQILPHFFSLNVWGWLSSVSLMLLAASLVTWVLKLNEKWRRSVRVSIFFFSISLMICVSSTVIRSMDLKQAVVLVSETPLRVAPLEKSPSSFVLPAGNVVRIESRRGPFLYVKFQDEKSGWVTDKEVAAVIPR